jgi:site-specific DNA recombinase
VLGGCSFGRGALYHLLRNRTYRGEVMHKGAVHPGEHEAIVGEELWTAVQAKLSANIQMGRRKRIETGALLMGLIFDDRGNRMSPSYTVRHGNRYRYYIAQAALRARGQKPGSRTCVGADDIETLVVDTLARALGRPELLDLGRAGAREAETRTFVQDTVERIMVSAVDIEILLKTTVSTLLKALGAEEPETDGNHDAESPIVLRAVLPAAPPRSRREILLPATGSGSSPRHVDEALILALARARSWMRALLAGGVAGTSEIAHRHGLGDPHVRRLLRFAYLAPDIVEAIVEGRQPRTLNVKRLLRGIPLEWADQRTYLGFRP